MRIEFNKYCVYKHFVNDKLLYIGKGDSRRPFTTSGRNEKWYSVVREAGHFDVEIIAWFKTSDEAGIFEEQQILALQPYANVQFNPKAGWKSKIKDGKVTHIYRKFKSPIIDVTTKQVFTSVARVVIATGLPGSAIYRELKSKNGRFQYKQLKPPEEFIAR